MRNFGNMSLLLLSCLACHVAFADEQLPPVEVTATVIGGGTATIPVFLMSAFHLGQPPNHPDAGQIDSFEIDMTKEQVCQVLRANQPRGCTTRNYPAAPPDISSASGAGWYGNGCGSDIWSSAEAEIALSVLLPGVFSGDLNLPVKGNRSINFTGFCNDHDRGYTSHFSKRVVDIRFSNALSAFCRGSTSQQLCNGFAKSYVDAVKKYGNAAYAADQADLECAEWGDSMKKNKCSA